MFKTKFIISMTIFVTFLTITSIIKNKTRVTEKHISHLKEVILMKKKNVNESELDFHYLTSPVVLEKKLNLIGYNNYQPIKYSNIYFNIFDLTKIHNKFSNLNDKKIQKK